VKPVARQHPTVYTGLVTAPRLAHLPESSSSLPRLLLIGWALWLLVSWAINLYLDGPPGVLSEQPFSRDAEAFVPTIRGMMVSAWLGLAVIWPAVRLSQAPPRRPTRHTVLDLFCLLSVLFVVMATLMLVVGWGAMQVGVLIVAFAGYSMWIAAWVDLGQRLSGTGRAVMMLLCLLTAGGAWMLPVDDERLMTLMFTPIAMLRALSEAVAPLDLPDGIAAAATVGAGGLAVWALGVWLLPPARA